MKQTVFAQVFLLSAIAACGRPASDIVHAPERGQSPSLGGSQFGNLDGRSEGCPNTKVLLKRSGAASVCVKIPQAQTVSAVSLASYWAGDAQQRCAILNKFIEAFRGSFMSDAQLAVSSCAPVTLNGQDVFVSITVSKGEISHGEAFEIAAARGTESIVSICTTERAYFVQNKHCTEAFDVARIPSSVAAIAPNPTEGLLDFYPSLSAFLSN